ncbi:MAG TPA: hypothetical protein VN646_24240, partial [Candidatus Acidoferrum sp.]|nr:hypothetical protein [Candidatus Acidoferrum sp.]
MQRSRDRILTTHTGSLPRPRDLVTMLREREEGRAVDGVALDARVRAAVFDAVQKQTAAGLAIVNDGEQGRVDYTVYVKDRLTGFDGESAPLPGIDADEFPEWTEMARQFAPPFQRRPACTGPVEWKDWPAVERDIETLGRATTGAGIEEVFMTSPSPGQIGRFLNNRYYPSDEAYLARVAEVMRREYEAIVRAGFVLQLDCPDLAMERVRFFQDEPMDRFLDAVALHIDAINEAIASIPP